jgi:hypothetical protein
MANEALAMIDPQNMDRPLSIGVPFQLAPFQLAERQNAPAERISFIDALRWLQHARPGQ